MPYPEPSGGCPQPRLLLVSAGVPGLGGNGSAGYDLFQRMSRDGAPVHLLNIIDEPAAAFIERSYGADAGNPLRLPNVRTCWLPGPSSQALPVLADLVEVLDPEVVIGFGFTPTLLLKRAAPARRTVLMTGTCRQAQDWVTAHRARDAMALTGRHASGLAPPTLLHSQELAAVEAADLIVTNSRLSLAMMQWFYPGMLGKISPHVVWYAEWICDGARAWLQHSRPFAERDIDVLFVANDWGRREKNFPLAAALAKRFRQRAVHLVGEAESPPTSATCHGFIARSEELFQLMGRARCVVSPSRIDAAPGVLFEASALGCNVVTSRNCGNWELCHPDLLADRCEAAPFAECIDRALRSKYEDNLAHFLTPGSYRDLLATIQALAQPFGPRA